MLSEEDNQSILLFFENIPKYYNCKTEIVEGIYARTEDFDANNTTWNLSEFILIRSAYRKKGNRLMMEGDKMYYELSAGILVKFDQVGRDKFEFIEQYSSTVFRITKIRFHLRPGRN